MKRERGGRGGSGWEPLGVAQGLWVQGRPSPRAEDTGRSPDPSGSQERLRAAGQPHSILCNAVYVHNQRPF